MSRVFVSEETALGSKVVIKVLPPETAAQVALERFKREILLARHGELPVNQAVRMLREIATALPYAHEHGIVHRDIKPDNVLLDPTLANSHAQMCLWWLNYGHDPAAASKEMEQSLKIDAANVAAGGWYPFLLRSYLHLPDSAHAVETRAQRLNPLSFGVWNPFFYSTDFATLSPDSARALCVRAARIQQRLAAECEARRNGSQRYSGCRRGRRRTSAGSISRWPTRSTLPSAPILE